MMYRGGMGLPGLLKSGYKHFSGLEEAIMKNVEAVKQLSKITQTSLGPNGMNKLVINHLEKIFVTSDAATIVKELEIMHPAAKMVVMAATMQEYEVGDGTNFVVTFAGELLLQAEELLRMGVHVSDIIAGYKKAADFAEKEIESMVAGSIENLRSKESLVKILKPVLASKQYGYEDMLGQLVADAALMTMPKGKPSFSVGNIRVAKILGSTIAESNVVKGVVVDRDALGLIKIAKDAKIAVYGVGVEAAATEAKGTVLIHNAEELLNYSKSEEKMMEENIKAIAASGVNVIVSGASVSEMALHFCNKYELMIIKITSKFELRRMCKTVGATAMVRLGAPTLEEMGHCDLVKTQEIGGRLITVFSQDDEKSAISTIVLRGSTRNLLDDFERAVNDGANAIKAYCKELRYLPGAGAFEIGLASKVNAFGETLPGLDQYAVKKYAEALEVVPRTLAENAGMVSTDILSSLYAAHADGKSSTGVDIENGGTLDAVAEGVIDSFAVKKLALNLSCDSAVTVLSVDQIIMSRPAGGPKPPKM